MDNFLWYRCGFKLLMLINGVFQSIFLQCSTFMFFIVRCELNQRKNYLEVCYLWCHLLIRLVDSGPLSWIFQWLCMLSWGIVIRARTVSSVDVLILLTVNWIESRMVNSTYSINASNIGQKTSWQTKTLQWSDF